MYFDEHNPPDFHVKYNEHVAVINIRTLNVSDGHLPAMGSRLGGRVGRVAQTRVA